MKQRRLIAFAGAVIIASSAPLLAGAAAASAATVPAATSSPVIVVPLGSCTIIVTINEDRDSSGAFGDALVNSDPCHIGIEGGIWSPDFTRASYGADVHSAGEESVTGPIAVNSGNHHGMRYWLNGTWNYAFAD